MPPRPYHHMDMIWALTVPVAVSVFLAIMANLVQRWMPKRKPRPEKRGFEVLQVRKMDSSR